MKRALFAASLILAIAVPGFTQVTFYYPQVANGGATGVVWKTTIFITNPAAAGTSLASGAIEFTTSDGTAFPISFVDEGGSPVGSGNTIPFQISGGQTRKYVSTGAGALTVGYATVNSTTPISGTAIFSSFATDGRLIGEAGVPAADLIPRQAIVVDTTAGFSTGVAFANPSNGGATITLSLVNTEGAVVATTTDNLGPRQHRARFVSELFQGQPGLAGTMQILSPATPLAAMALRFDPSRQLFTTLPPVTLASIFRPVLEWFQQRPWGSPFAAIASLMG